MNDIFGAYSIKIDNIGLKLKELLAQIDPIVINYGFKYGSSMAENERMFDIAVDIDTPFNADIMPLFVQKLIFDEKEHQKVISGQSKSHPSILLNERIRAADRKMLSVVNKIKTGAAKLRAYEDFAQNPSTFIENFVYEQNKLLQVIQNHPDHQIKGAAQGRAYTARREKHHG